MKKALFILEDINQSGSPLTALHFIEALENKYDVSLLLLCIQDENVDLARKADFEKHVKAIEEMKLPNMKSKIFKLLYTCYMKNAIKRVNELFKKENFDLVYTNRLNVAGSIFPHIKSHFKDTKTIYNSLGNLRDRKESKYPFLRRRDNKIRQKTIGNTDYFVANSKQGVFKNIENYKNIFVIRDYPNIELKKDKKEYSNKKTIRLGQIGYYCTNKNQLFSLEILSKLVKDGYEASMSFMGFEIAETGDYLVQMKNYIKANSLSDRVLFLDSHNDKISFFNSVDILLCPSHTEGLPLVLLESQYQKTPCLASLAIPEEADLGFLKRLPLEDINAWNNYLESEEYKSNQKDCEDLKASFFKKIDSLFN